MKLLAMTLAATVATAAAASARPAAHGRPCSSTRSRRTSAAEGARRTPWVTSTSPAARCATPTGARAVGHFAFTCRTTAILGGGDAREHCAGWGQTADGRIGFAGPTRLERRHARVDDLGPQRGLPRRARHHRRARRRRSGIAADDHDHAAGRSRPAQRRPRASGGRRCLPRRADRSARARHGSSRRCRPSRSRPSTHSTPTRQCSRRSAGSSPDPTTRGPPFARSTHA